MGWADCAILAPAVGQITTHACDEVGFGCGVCRSIRRMEGGQSFLEFAIVFSKRCVASESIAECNPMTPVDASAFDDVDVKKCRIAFGEEVSARKSERSFTEISGILHDGFDLWEMTH